MPLARGLNSRDLADRNHSQLHLRPAVVRIPSQLYVNVILRSATDIV